MSFYASHFIYDNINSQEYDLTITSLDGSGVTRSPGASSQLQTVKIYRNPKPYFFGVEESPVLTIPIEITVSSELDSTQSSFISRWLFGQKNYKKLQIIQPDMMYVYFNCIIVNPQIIKVGNTIRGYSAEAICDSPFAWSRAIAIDFPYGLENYEVNDTITINNLSDSSDYYYPNIEFKMNQFSGGLQVINMSDNENRHFIMDNLYPDEIIRINGYSKIISSNKRENPIANFSGEYNWIRYTPGKNIIRLIGNINYIRFINSFPKKVI